MLKVVNTDSKEEINFYVFGYKLTGPVEYIPSVPFYIEASGEELDKILDNFSGICKTSASFQVFSGEDAEFILRNWNYV